MSVSMPIVHHELEFAGCHRWARGLVDVRVIAESESDDAIVVAVSSDKAASCDNTPRQGWTGVPCQRAPYLDMSRSVIVTNDQLWTVAG